MNTIECLWDTGTDWGPDWARAQFIPPWPMHTDFLQMEDSMWMWMGTQSSMSSYKPQRVILFSYAWGFLIHITDFQNLTWEVRWDLSPGSQQVPQILVAQFQFIRVLPFFIFTA